MAETPEQTAFQDFDGDKRCISFTDLKGEDGTWYIRIPEPIADLDYLNIKQGDVELYHNDDCFISLGAYTGQGLKELNIDEDEDGYWLEVPDDLDAIQPLNRTTRTPILFLGCGELWIMTENDLWNKLAAQVGNE